MNEPIFVGIDWATESHVVCVLDAHGNVLARHEVRHRATDLAELCDSLARLVDHEPQRILVAIEVPHGAVVDTLLERHFVVHSINPKQLDRFRDRFTAAAAKDDRRDAHVLADSLRTDPRAFRRLSADEPLVIELREFSRMHEEISRERVQLTNRLREQIRRYFPAFLDVAKDPGDAFSQALFRLVPTPDRAHQVKPYRIAKLLKEHRIRRIEAAEVLAKLREPKLIVADGTTTAAIAHIHLLHERLAMLIQQQKQVQKSIERLLQDSPRCHAQSEPGDADATSSDSELPQSNRSAQRDAAILLSIPGVGRTIVATLLAEGSRLIALRDYQGLRALSGIAPVTRSSGKRLTVAMRKACHGRLRNAMHAWAFVAMQHDPKSKARYQELRARGATIGRALRTVADRLLRIACAMLRDQSMWDPTAHDSSAAA